MHLPSVQFLIYFLLVGVMGIILSLPLQAGAVQCGDELLSGGTVVLEADLTCTPSDPEGSAYESGLVVGLGTILDLNGHTISCAEGLKRAIRIGGSQVRNGAIANCEEGLYTDGHDTVIEGVVLRQNKWGVYVEGGDRNTFRANVAMENKIGFLLRDGADDNLLIDNIATQNQEAGFFVGPGRRDQVVGNTASDNGVGFILASSEMWVQGNTAEGNDEAGFMVHGYGEFVGNTATQNSEIGFLIDSKQPLRVQHNLARENGGDGFFLPADFWVHRRVLRHNVALNNGGHGIHVESDGRPKSTIAGNTARGHLSPFFDLADDNVRCHGSVWRKNTFKTASQGCIH